MAILAKVAPNGGSLGHPVGRKVLEKRVPHPYGARSEAIRRVYLGCTVPQVPKYTLRMASDLAPYGRGTFFSNTLRPTGCPTTVWGHFGPKWPKITQKGGTPFFDHFFRKVAEIQTPFSPIFEKKCGSPPRWTILRGGGGIRTFFRKSAKMGSGFLLPS